MKHPYLYLFRRTILWLKHSVSFLWLFVVAAYLLVMAGNAFYRNYQSQQQTKDLENQLQAATIEKERLQALLVYYQTDSFKEKELRSMLLMKRPDETVYALPESSTVIKVEDAIAQASAEGLNKKKPSTIPIWKQWVNYIWYADKG